MLILMLTMKEGRELFVINYTWCVSMAYTLVVWCVVGSEYQYGIMHQQSASCVYHHSYGTLHTLISDAVPSIHRSIDQAWMDISSGLEVVLKFSGHRADGLLTLAQLFYQLFLLLLYSPSCVFLQVPGGRSQQTARRRHVNNTSTSITHRSCIRSSISQYLWIWLTD